MKPHKTIAALAAIALLAAGCGGRGGTNGEEEPGGAGQSVSGDFGDLKGVCGPGEAKSAPAQGVTAKEIEVGVFTDIGFTKKSELVDTAKVFTSWCNEAGGVNGRKLVVNIRDAKLFEARQRMIEACREDFAIVGGSAVFDGTAVKDRLTCLLPDFPGQTVQNEANGSDLQVYPLGAGHSYNRYHGYWSWLIKEAYPDSASAIGTIAGDSPGPKILAAQGKEALTAAGGKVVYSDLHPAQGVSDWTPYAQAIKSKGVKGLVFFGDFNSLSKLMLALTNIDYKLDWIDANANAYNPAFIKIAGKTLDTQNAFADLSGMHPLEEAGSNPATKQFLDLFAKYAPGKEATQPGLRAFSSWLLFAKAAKSCGDALTRKCVLEAAQKETSWTGGGLIAPIDLSKKDAPLKCFNVVKASSQGWKPADFKPNSGAYRCDAPEYKYTGSYGKPVTLADVGKSLSDLK
ncbi:ABC-type branched-chain amino acid transport system, substrate-binding protein [Thermomonospora echinospora]|uniref:ABC-type branched-chain amino acid transport system, substrate-binding protein n=1 Tax=Thermomonospora echinospora TaxID=1992 RepID=A0A1H6DIK4_9ACTN|nr:ABC transporter substrate-binding protein [Thermomonospora echinospora]SEG85021.1 ABC-type branched-chain amino acid transport system, substrate-binding protein [Thermomonospora echinospora]